MRSSIIEYVAEVEPTEFVAKAESPEPIFVSEVKSVDVFIITVLLVNERLMQFSKGLELNMKL